MKLKFVGYVLLFICVCTTAVIWTSVFYGFINMDPAGKLIVSLFLFAIIFLGFWTVVWMTINEIQREYLLKEAFAVAAVYHLRKGIYFAHFKGYFDNSKEWVKFEMQRVLMHCDVTTGELTATATEEKSCCYLFNGNIRGELAAIVNSSEHTRRAEIVQGCFVNWEPKNLFCELGKLNLHEASSRIIYKSGPQQPPSEEEQNQAPVSM